ncbi:IclR family transcriptional regulator [Kribbella capetownensis]|uniref:Glycerol operon regulatory protein n=1 Tax=Kribbella capetownensis TaxID=1572659 RepID=A0A4R0JZN9_9ACTN|nr:IclR family transcriptional regulator [Kribbella capetownensis]TCC47925.1 IclR family transcriptional regulator [Kribbella capetownensis]
MPGTVQSIERAAAVLRLLAAAPDGLGVADLGNALGLAKPTVHGILRTLQQVGFVEQDHTGAHYHLSDIFGRLGESYLDPNELRSRAINWADSLASRSGEVVRVGRLVDGKVEVVHHVFRPDDSDQDLDVGTTLPPHATALGKAVLAFDTSGAARPRRLEAYTTRTITDPARLAEELATVRARGWASELEEHTVELASIAAPIRGLGGLVVGAVGLAGRLERICDSKLRHRPDLISMVRSTAEAIARDLREDT